MTTLTLYMCVLFLFCGTNALNNGVGRTPPLGWNTWKTCGEESCGHDICNEAEIKSVAMAMIQNGMQDLGYNYVNLDDCWHQNAMKQIKLWRGMLNVFPVVYRLLLTGFTPKVSSLVYIRQQEIKRVPAEIERIQYLAPGDITVWTHKPLQIGKLTMWN